MVTDEQFRAAGYSGKAREYPMDESALRLLCAFNGVDWRIAPPAWWFAPNPWMREAWRRVAAEAARIQADGQMDERSP